MKRAILFSALGLAAVAAAFGFRLRKPRSAVVNQEKGPVLVELFTSEGCSSCPSADALLAKLGRSQPFAGRVLIPIEEHVDYWNNLGWADPFSSADFSARQTAYAKRFSLDGPYTPQAVVNGTTEFVGSDEGALTKAVTSAPTVSDISVSPSAGGATVQVPAADQARNIYLVQVEGGLSSHVTAGENAGWQLQHGYVVRFFKKVGVAPAGQTFSGKFTLPSYASGKPRDINVIAFAQVGETGPIVAIGQLRQF